MEGQRLKEKILETNVPFNELAERLGITSQSLNSNFNVKDVRSGTIERIAKALNVPISYFFDDEKSIIATGNGSVNVAGNNNSTAVGSKESENGETAAFLREIIKNLFSQIDRLNGEIETLRDIIDFYKMENLQNQAKK